MNTQVKIDQLKAGDFVEAVFDIPLNRSEKILSNAPTEQVTAEGNLETAGSGALVMPGGIGRASGQAVVQAGGTLAGGHLVAILRHIPAKEVS